MDKHLLYTIPESSETVECYLTDQFCGYPGTLLMCNDEDGANKIFDALPDYWIQDDESPEIFFVDEKAFRKTTRSRSTTALTVFDLLLNSGFSDNTEEKVVILPECSPDDKIKLYEDFDNEQQALNSVQPWDAVDVCYPTSHQKLDLVIHTIGGGLVKEAAKLLGAKDLFDEDLEFYMVCLRNFTHGDKSFISKKMVGAEVIRHAVRLGKTGVLHVLVPGNTWVPVNAIEEHRERLEYADIADAAYKVFRAVSEHEGVAKEYDTYEKAFAALMHEYRAYAHTEEFSLREKIRAFITHELMKKDLSSRTSVPKTDLCNPEKWDMSEEGFSLVRPEDTELLYIAEAGEVGLEYRKEGYRNIIDVSKCPEKMLEVMMTFNSGSEDDPAIEAVVYLTSSADRTLILWSLHILDGNEQTEGPIVAPVEVEKKSCCGGKCGCSKPATDDEDEPGESEGCQGPCGGKGGCGSACADCKGKPCGRKEETYVYGDGDRDAEIEDDNKEPCYEVDFGITLPEGYSLDLDYLQLAFDFLKTSDDTCDDGLDPDKVFDRSCKLFTVANVYIGLPKHEMEPVFGTDPREDPAAKPEDYVTVVLCLPGCTDRDWQIVFRQGAPDVVYVDYHED
jgi:hypothetical protein